MRRGVTLLVAVLGSVGGAAAHGDAIGPADARVMKVDRVEIRITASVPRQVSVQVHGILEDGCTSLGAVRAQREGHTITVTIATNHSGAERCALTAQLVDETVRLPGDFPPGRYVLRVNGVERRFRI